MTKLERLNSAHRRGNALWQALLVSLVAMSLLIVGFGAGAATTWFLGPSLRRTASVALPVVDGEVQSSREEKAELLWNVWDILSEEFINPEALDDQKMIYGAAAGLVRTLGDSHTMFVEPVPAKIMDEDLKGTFEGIGATVNVIEGQLTIVKPLPNSPALAAGLRKGDVILAVDGESLEGKDLLESIALIRGPQGTVIRLLVRREETPDPFIVPVTRDKVEMPTVELRRLEGDIAYLRLTEFNGIAKDRVREALEDLLKDDPAGLIFDLRHNPGGYLQVSIDIAGEFLPKGTLLLTEEERDKPPKEHSVKRSGIATDVPLVVLVDGASASASEIVAGALQDNGRGTLVGETTYGKGSVQVTHTFDDDSSLRVTTAKWYLPSGGNLDGNGIAPDIEVPLTSDDVAADKDPQLERAVAFLLTGE